MTYPSSKGAGEYGDMLTFLNVGKMTVEQDGASLGFMEDNTQGVANAFRISDSLGPNANMQVRFDGRTLIYGF